jgi:hypothetical protein
MAAAKIKERDKVLRRRAERAERTTIVRGKYILLIVGEALFLARVRRAVRKLFMAGPC